MPSHAAEHHRNGRNRSLDLSERSEFSNSRPFRGAQGSRRLRDRLPFLVRFLGKQNEHIKNTTFIQNPFRPFHNKILILLVPTSEISCLSLMIKPGD